MKKNIIVIPARYHSSRFPGKPLAKIKGKSLIHRVWSLAKQVKQIDEVYIATDHCDIESHVLGFGGKVMMTEEAVNGTERVFQAVQGLGLCADDAVINLQGDAVLTPPWVIQSLVDALGRSINLQIATLAVQITKKDYAAIQVTKTKGEVGASMVVFDKNYQALYFSKSMIPYIRDETIENPPIYRHIGLYAYRYATLQRYISLPTMPLEQLEGLEPLRALENGIPIQVIMADYQRRTHGSIDSPDDIARVTQIIEKEGELDALP